MWPKPFLAKIYIKNKSVEINFILKNPKENNRPNGKNSHILVTLFGMPAFRSTSSVFILCM
jgi:hypothetical protein